MRVDRLLRVLLFDSDEPLVGSTWVLLVVVGAAGAVLDSEPGMPSASRKVARSSATTSERVRGPLSRLSKSSVVLSVWVKSSTRLTCERTLASPTMGERICMMRPRKTSSICCLCCSCAEVRPSFCSVDDSVMSLPTLSTTVTWSGER